MAKAHYLSDKDGNKIYPYAHTKATYTTDGKLLDTKLTEIEGTIPTVSDTYSSTSSDAMSGKALALALAGIEHPIWIGTNAEYNAQKSSIAEGTLICITDN